MKWIIAALATLGLVGTLLIRWTVGGGEAASFSTAYFFLAANLIILTISWWFIFRKKLIAISFPIIVFKYALLAAILYPLMNTLNLHKEWMIAGFAVFFAALTVITLLARTNTCGYRKEKLKK